MPETLRFAEVDWDTETRGRKNSAATQNEIETLAARCRARSFWEWYRSAKPFVSRFVM